MDDKDLKIAELEGQVKAYQEQLRSVSIDLLRSQVKTLQDGERARERLVRQCQESFGKLSVQVNERLDKARDKFTGMQDQIHAIEAKMPEEPKEENGDGSQD